MPVSSVRTWCAVLSILTVLPVHAVQHSKGVGSVGIGDGDLRAASYGGGGHSGRNTVGTILAIRTILPVSSVRTWCAVLSIMAVLTVHTVQHSKGVGTVGIGDGDLRAACNGGGGHGGGNTVGTILTICAIVPVGTRCAVLTILAITPVSTCRSLRPCITFFPFVSLFAFLALFALWTLCPGITFITLIALVSLVTFVTFVAFGTTDALHAASERCGRGDSSRTFQFGGWRYAFNRAGKFNICHGRYFTK